MIVRYSPVAKRTTVGADKGFDSAESHLAQNRSHRRSATAGRTTHHCGYASRSAHSGTKDRKAGCHFQRSARSGILTR